MQFDKVQKKKSYFVDRKFYPRLKEYIENGRNYSSDVDDIVDYLQTSFPEYSRKKRNALKHSVQKALNDNLEMSKTDKSSFLEEKHLAKKLKMSRSDDHFSSYLDEQLSNDSESSIDESMLVEFKDSNYINSSMQNLYKTTVPPPLAQATTSTPTYNNKSASKLHTDKAQSNVDTNDVEKVKLLPKANGLPETRSLPQTNQLIDSSISVLSKKALESNEHVLISSNKIISLQSESDPSVLPKKLFESDQQDLPKKSLTSLLETNQLLKSNTPVNSVVKSTRKSAVKEKKFEAFTSNITFKDIGGYESALEDVSKLLLHLKHPEVFLTLGIKPPRGFLLHGAPGCGKTLLANAIAGELQVPFFKIAATEIVSGISGESEQKIRALFNEATAAAPSILFIDEIDSITPKRESAGKESERRVVTQILTCMDELAHGDSHVLVIGATNRADSIDPALRRAGRFDREIAMGIPSKEARVCILKVICRDMRLEAGFDFEKIASLTPGFVGADMQALAREAAICAVESAFKSDNVVKALFPNEYLNNKDVSINKKHSVWLQQQPPLSDAQLSNLFLTTHHFEQALPHVQPSAKREGFATVPDVSWKDIGALEDIREELTMAIMAPVHNPEEFESLGLVTPPGILLAGPPGCGKTLLAKAIANEAGINFISVKGPELLNMYVGESEKAVRQVFQRAKNSAPCVIFFDEIDALCPRRSETGDSSASSRVVNQLLTEMDGLETRKNVFIMGATNRPDILDAAILRPGRLDKLLYVGLPNQIDRKKILNTITMNGTKPKMADDVTIEVIASDQRCEGFSGADLSALVREASVTALKEFMKNSFKTSSTSVSNPSTGSDVLSNGYGVEEKKTSDVSDSNTFLPSHPINTSKTEETKKILVSRAHFETAFEKVKPSVSGADRIWYDDMKKKNVRK
ncbi:nuclear valosin-containing protein-like isoform X2 [Hydra vulgaris]|uniref:Nuclear valosin-containing protein-like isoform X2 n=1 Tax=Hydra vulgaris TaxID=6087 RepID=A0ABM4CK01_HYDVU